MDDFERAINILKRTRKYTTDSELTAIVVFLAEYFDVSENYILKHVEV